MGRRRDDRDRRSSSPRSSQTEGRRAIAGARSRFGSCARSASARRARTPAAGTITYNVAGSLLTSAERRARDAVPRAVPPQRRGARRLVGEARSQTDYDAIVAKCGTEDGVPRRRTRRTTRCVRGGTYYAFQPNNGDTVHEYAAELAVRYFERAARDADHEASCAQTGVQVRARRERPGVEGAGRRVLRRARSRPALLSAGARRALRTQAYAATSVRHANLT